MKSISPVAVLCCVIGGASLAEDSATILTSEQIDSAIEWAENLPSTPDGMASVHADNSRIQTVVPTDMADLDGAIAWAERQYEVETATTDLPER